MAYFMEPVRNYRKYLQKTSDAIGFKAVDEATVEITLSRAYTYFLSYLAAYVWSVVDPAVWTRKAMRDFALKDAGTGPWRFTEFDASSQLVMEPNQNHYGGVSPSIVKIVWPFVTGPTAASTALNHVQAGQGDLGRRPDFAQIVRRARSGTLRRSWSASRPSGSVRVLAFDFKQAPFNDVRIRQAFGLAVDRDKFKSIFEDTWTPTRSFTPPAVTAEQRIRAAEGSDHGCRRRPRAAGGCRIQGRRGSAARSPITSRLRTPTTRKRAGGHSSEPTPRRSVSDRARHHHVAGPDRSAPAGQRRPAVRCGLVVEYDRDAVPAQPGLASSSRLHEGVLQLGRLGGRRRATSPRALIPASSTSWSRRPI